MILILSMYSDISTSDVIDWLNFYRASFIRLNHENLCDVNIEINKNDTKIKISSHDKKIYLNDIKSFWYRRGNFNISINKFNEKNTLSSCLNEYNENERIFTNKFIHDFMKRKNNSINSFTDNFIDKLKMLDIARKIGILVPDTLVTQSKKDVLDHIAKHKSIITKPITNGFSCIYKEINFYLHTIKLN